MTRISLETARRIVLRSQLLDHSEAIPAGKQGVMQIISRLGYVQIDPLSAIKRTHHHTLWTRVPGYHEKILDELQSKDRKVFEYWGHALSFFPMADYRYSLPRMQNFHNPVTQWAKYYLTKSGHLMEPLRRFIQNEGPAGQKELAAAHISDSNEAIKGALDLLFWKGDLMVTKRHNLVRTFDLTERVLPGNVDTNVPTEDETARFLVRRALLAFGVALETEIQVFMQPETSRDSHMQAASKGIMSKSLRHMVDSGEVISLSINELDDRTYYALNENMSALNQMSRSGRIYLLSPFDNLIIQRDRLKNLFNFEYLMESYKPAAKRVYGYYVLPILWGNRFVGRLDPKADRKKSILVIHNLVFEPELKEFDLILPELAAKLVELAQFNELEKLRIEKVSPAKVKSALIRGIKDSDLELV